ncbi:acetyltransferase [Nodosilinea sp. P-1105]|uniref:acetyltransferase n=1 Tax=Nodosilinea sp. P-1105 TaxID=2546229 RepID=UPI00146F5628|nr:acetyltransferase [Nodosilinea sp. P-1105]NMF84553.1 acetyltransferase [Nodosilinea sp. P-1105]
MFVKDRQSQSLIKVIDTDTLFNPTHATVQGRPQQGEEEQPAQSFDKAKLIFPSGEPLPQCWIDPDYQM